MMIYLKYRCHATRLYTSFRHMHLYNSILCVLCSVSAASIPVRLNEYYMELFTTSSTGTYVIGEKLEQAYALHSAGIG